MILVCNAGPVIALAKIDRLSLLESLATSVSIPEIVFHEILAKPGVENERILQATRTFLKVIPSATQTTDLGYWLSDELIDTVRRLAGE